MSLIGTFAGLYALGFSINTLTLFAMVLAIGIVVDDAIVVLENVERLMREEKMSAKQASIEAMHEVSGAVLAIVLVLCAVFIPVAFLGGIAGVLYRQFAVTARDLRRHLGVRRAYAHARALRAAAEIRRARVPLLPAVQRRLREDDQARSCGRSIARSRGVW